MNNIYEKLYGNINYKTYDGIEHIFLYSSVGVIFANNFIISEPNMAISYLGLSLSLASMAMLTSKGNIYTKDAKEVVKLYKELIGNYNRLNKMFCLKDPIEIYELYLELLNNGYLSKDKMFDYDNNCKNDIMHLLGASIVSGVGVCRHIAAMLCDIYKDYGIDTSVLSVCSKATSINVSTSSTPFENPEESKKELMAWVRETINDEITIKKLEEIIDSTIESEFSLKLSKKLEEEPNYLKRFVGNHVITYAHKDGYNYFLDPTQNKIYSQNNKNSLNDYGEVMPMRYVVPRNTIFTSLKDERRMKKNIKKEYPTLPYEIERELIQNTYKIFVENKDIFEKFYNDNVELYRDLDNQIKKTLQLQ